MAVPRDIDARKYYRAAIQRLDEAELILIKLRLPAAAIYLTGYAVECILKSLLLNSASASGRMDMLRSLKNEFGHNLRRLRAGLIERGMNPPRDVSRELVFVSGWSPELRYEPGPGDPKEGDRFVAAAKLIVKWADGRM